MRSTSHLIRIPNPPYAFLFSRKKIGSGDLHFSKTHHIIACVPYDAALNKGSWNMLKLCVTGVLYRRFSAYDLLRRMIKKFITFHLVEMSIAVLWLEILSCVLNSASKLCRLCTALPLSTLFGYGTVLSASSFAVKLSSSFHGDAWGAQTGCRGPRMDPHYEVDAHQNRTIYA